ncbi:MAG: tetratricopeptide repeat protein [Balneolaceae bacterium]
MIRTFFFILSAFIILATDVTAQTPEVTDPDLSKALEYFIDGINDFENQDYELALDKLMAAHLILSDDPGINYALSDVYLATGDFTNAAYYGQIAAEKEPENKWYLLHLAEIYRASGRNEMSIETLKQVLVEHPRDMDVLFMLSESFLKAGNLEASNEILDQILEQRSSIYEIHLKKFQNYNAMGEDERALDELLKIRELNPGNLTTLHTISQFYMELGDFSSAEEVLMDAYSRNPEEPTTLLLLAEIYSHNEEWGKLGDTFLTMIENPHINPEQKMELVRFVAVQSQNHNNKNGLLEQAERLILAFSHNETEYGPAQLLAADFYLQQNDLENALQTLEQVNQNFPDNTDAWVQRLQLLFTLNRYEEVIELSEAANERAPDNAFIQFFTGASYMLNDQYSIAESWLENATLAPSQRTFRSIIYGTLGDVKQELDKWSDTVDAFESAIRLDRNNHTALNNYAYYLSLRDEKFDEALEMSKLANRLEPENASYLDTMGWIYFKKGDYDNALMYIQQSIDTGEASAEVYEHLGDVYNALGEVENAQIWWEKAFDLDSDRTHLQERF